MISSYFLLGGILAGVCLLAALMFISSRVHYLWKIGASVALVAISIYAWTAAVSAFGYAVPGYPPDGSIIIATDFNTHTNLISYWVEDKGGPRAYVTPYEEKTAKELKDAEDKAWSEGGKMVFHFRRQVVGDKKPPAVDHNKSHMGTSIDSDANPPPVSIDVIPSMPEKQG